MNILIIGYGSIGRRHDAVLSKILKDATIDIVSSQTIANRRVYKTLSQIDRLSEYDYFIISSPTRLHYEQLIYIESMVSGKLILCEKPLFETEKAVKALKNNIFIGYVLRFHPIMQALKAFLERERILFAQVYCGQYLPTWRPQSDYAKSYSSSKTEGGGVLLDLSHEIDYTEWLFGKIIDIKSYQAKVSDLEIDSDDIVSFVGKTDAGALVSVTVDYISKMTQRRILIHTVEHTYDVDLICGTLNQKNKQGDEEKMIFPGLERNYMFEQMHLDVLNERLTVCSFNEAMDVMKTISIIQRQNNE